MTDIEVIQKLYNLLKVKLNETSPVLSGNMKQHIKVRSVDLENKKVVLEVSGPSYDIGVWERTGVICHNSKFDYANLVNKYGGFGTRNKSMHWVNRACYNVCYTIANEIGAVLENELEL